MVPIRDWGDAIFTSVTQAMALFLAAIPKVIGFAIILAIGWLVASLVAKGVGALLRTISSTIWRNDPGLQASCGVPALRRMQPSLSQISPSGSFALLH